MWINHLSVYQEHLKYICNGIVNPFRVKILCYAKRVREMYEFEKYPPQTLMKGVSAGEVSYKVCS